MSGWTDTGIPPDTSPKADGRSVAATIRLPTGSIIPSRVPVPPPGDVSGPLVSCLMVTRGDRPAVAEAIACYRRQSYANRELVIVCDAADNLVEPMLADLRDPSIRYHRAAPATLGELRNLSAIRAGGALLCQWDDDDLYHPMRLEMQVAALDDATLAASFVSRWLIWQPLARRVAVARPRLWEGSMLIRRGAMLLYPSLSRGEDPALVRTLCRHHPVVGIDAPNAYVYVSDGSNTWHREHFDALMLHSTETFEGASYEELLASLSSQMPVAARAARVGQEIL